MPVAGEITSSYFVMSLLAVLGFIGSIVAYMLGRIVAHGPSHPLKDARYEAGNPPTPRARVPTIPQYYGYIIIFIVLDPLFALLFLTPPSTSIAPLRTLAWILLVSAILLPPLFYALRYAERIEYWVTSRAADTALEEARRRRSGAGGGI